MNGKPNVPAARPMSHCGHYYKKILAEQSERRRRRIRVRG